MVFLAIFLLFISVLLEGTFFALPLVLALLIVLQIAYRSGIVMLAAFISGLFLDTIFFRPFGQSSLFLLSFLTLLALYERRFEVQTYPFLLGSVVAGASAYLIFFGSSNFFIQLFITTVFSLMLFVVFVRRSVEREGRLASR